VTYEAHERVGSLGIVAVLLAFAVVAARPRLRAQAEIGRLVPIAITVRLLEPAGERTVEALAPVTIGRDREATVFVADAEASRSHARLDAEGGVIFLRDLESRNGTFLNGRRIRSAIEVREGDEIDVGTTRMIVERLAPWT
jgi:pSer/pThr/pTyr-binding forkhead associated (FHA) protein